MNLLEHGNKLLKMLNEHIEEMKQKDMISNFSDGCHTFEELYFHRMILFSVICSIFKGKSWKSKLHNDGTMFNDYFIVGINTPDGQFTYHYHISNWNFFKFKELEKAPKYDGHDSSDVLRLISLLKKDD